MSKVKQRPGLSYESSSHEYIIGPPEVYIERESIEINETESLTINCHVKSLIPMLVQLKWHNRVLEEVKVE